MLPPPIHRRPRPRAAGGVLRLLLLLGLTACHSTAPPAPAPVPAGEEAAAAILPLGATGLAFDLPDQYGGRVTYPLPPDALPPDGSAPVVIVAYAGRRGADGRQAWQEALRERYGEHLEWQAAPGLVVLPVAHMPPLPAFLRPVVVERHLDDRPPTGLDWNRTVAEQLGYTPGVPNLAVLAPDGRFLGVIAGEATAKTKAQLFEVLETAGLPSE